MWLRLLRCLPATFSSTPTLVRMRVWRARGGRVGGLSVTCNQRLEKAFGPAQAVVSCRYQGHVSTALVIGGVDCTGPHLYTIYPHGSVDKCAPVASMIPMISATVQLRARSLPMAGARL